MKICVLNLGCKVNQYEVDAIANGLAGDEVVTGLVFADIYVLNTCAVTGEAEKKSRQYIAKINKINSSAKIIVCGCAAERSSTQFLEKPNVTAVLGTSGKGKIKDIIQDIKKEKEEIQRKQVEEISNIYEDNLFSKQVRTRGYLKIQDGCDNFCSYCLIPYVRGRSRSRPLKSVVEEAEKLAQNCKEIVITGINISDYQIDGQPALLKLMTALKGIKCRLRLSSIENTIITEDFLQIACGLKNLCPHFHLSLQSGSNKVLKDMNRHYTREQFLECVSMIKKYFKDAAITTDIIVGYPTETEEDFLQSLSIVGEAGFSDVHFFAYSARTGTRAAKLKQIDGKIIKEREHRLLQTAQEYKKKYNQAFIGKKLQVLAEEQKDGYFTGYSQNYIRCYIKGNINAGEIITVTGAELFKDGLLCN